MNSVKANDILPAPKLRAQQGRQEPAKRTALMFPFIFSRQGATHKGKYVAIHQSKVVDTGGDKLALALRVYKRFGYVPIYVGQVLPEPPPPERMPSPRLLKSVPA
ncbi:MAG: hypothetical protein C5B50_26605 [Verrucomicrobia bacterium]|nr:MAG: hypothetical protein C5B50_26605 [Verrucomicrobiota bacterium]